MSATAFQRLRREQEAKKLQSEQRKPITLADLKVAELKEIAKEKGIEGFDNMKKLELIEAIEQQDSKGAE